MRLYLPPPPCFVRPSPYIQGPSPLPRSSGSFFGASSSAAPGVSKGPVSGSAVATEPRQRSRIPTRVRSRSQGPVVKFALPDSEEEEQGEQGEEGEEGRYYPSSVPTRPGHGHYYDEDDDDDPFLASPVSCNL